MARPGQTPRAGGEKTPKAKDDEGLQARKKATKKRKKRLPKEGTYNPNADPDPERWLPKKERTGLKYMPGGYRKPRKDKRKPEKFTGAQGTDVGKAEAFDYSGKMAASRPAPSRSRLLRDRGPSRRSRKMPTRARRRKARSSSRIIWRISSPSPASRVVPTYS